MFCNGPQADNKDIEEDVVRRINEIVKAGRGESNLFELLNNPVMGLSDNILPFATPLYLSELQYIFSSFRKGKNNGLSTELVDSFIFEEQLVKCCRNTFV